MSNVSDTADSGSLGSLMSTDRQRVFGLFFLFFLVIAAFWVQKPIRTSHFLTTAGATNLPWVKLGSALLMLPVVLLYSALAAHYQRERLVYLCVGLFSIASVAFWWLLSSDPPPWLGYVYFFYVDIFNSVMVALFWSFANDLTAPAAAKRTYGFIGAGGIIGGAVGSMVTGAAAQGLGTANLLLLCIVLLICIAAVARAIARRSPAAPATSTGHEPSLRDAIAGARLTVASRYLTCVALLVALYEVVSNVIDYQFNVFVAARFHDEAAMASFLGWFSSAAIVVSIGVQFVATTWILRRWGPRVGLLVLPIALAFGSAAFLALTTFAAISAAFLSDAALSYSLNQTTKEVLYTPTDASAKYQAKAFIDMFLMRSAKGVSALLILAWTAWMSPLGLQTQHLGLVSLAVIALWLLVAYAAGRRFDELTRGGHAPEAPQAQAMAVTPVLARSTLLLFVVLSCASVPGRCDAEPGSDGRGTISDAEVNERLAFLEHTLDERRLYADLWWKGWTGFYGLGMVVQSVEAARTDDGGRRADYIVSAVKALGGVINQVRRPLFAAQGADPIRALPGQTREQRQVQLKESEILLRRRAEQADQRFSWVRHSANFGVNLAGGVIVSEGFDERTRGWRSAAIGFAVGELMIWSQPWWPRAQLGEYERRFAVGNPNRVSWEIVPTVGGGAVAVRF